MFERKRNRSCRSYIVDVVPKFIGLEKRIILPNVLGHPFLSELPLVETLHSIGDWSSADTTILIYLFRIKFFNVRKLLWVVILVKEAHFFSPKNNNFKSNSDKDYNQRQLILVFFGRYFLLNAEYAIYPDFVGREKKS